MFTELQWVQPFGSAHGRDQQTQIHIQTMERQDSCSKWMMIIIIIMQRLARHVSARRTNRVMISTAEDSGKKLTK